MPAPVSPALIGVIADNLDGWMMNFYLATRALASAVAEGRVSEDRLHAFRAAGEAEEALAALADAIGFEPRDDGEAVAIALDAIYGLVAGSAIIGDEWRPGMVYTWYFDDADELSVHGTTIAAFRRETRTLTIRQAAEVLMAAFTHLREGRPS